MNCEAIGRFLALWPEISRMGRVASDLVRGMSVTQSVRAGHIANLKGRQTSRNI